MNVYNGSRVEDYDEYLSDLWTVGAIGLEMKRTGEGMYARKEVNMSDVEKRIGEVRDSELRQGLTVLMRVEPKERADVFRVWGLDNQKQHYLTPASDF